MPHFYSLSVTTMHENCIKYPHIFNGGMKLTVAKEMHEINKNIDKLKVPMTFEVYCLV